MTRRQMQMIAGEPILFEHGPEQATGEVIDFAAHRLGLVRRALSHDVIYGDADDADEFDVFMLAASGRRGR